MLTILLLAVALSADGFAVAICRGAGTSHKWRNALWTGFIFGAVHALAIAIGWVVGDILEAWKNIAPYVACLLLVMLGGKMLWESQKVEDAAAQASRPEHIIVAFVGLLSAAIATSMDGVAAGVTLPLMGFPLALDAAVIGGITGVLCVLGYRMGALIGDRWGKYAEVAGGLILIGIGIKLALFA